jgi:hypothetical protein
MDSGHFLVRRTLAFAGTRSRFGLSNWSSWSLLSLALLLTSWWWQPVGGSTPEHLPNNRQTALGRSCRLQERYQVRDGIGLFHGGRMRLQQDVNPIPPGFAVADS